MVKNFDDMQKVTKDGMDAAMSSFGTATKNAQTIAAEVTDYSRKSFEDGSQAFEKLLGAKSFETAIEVQTAFVKDSYEGFMAQASKLGSLYTEMAKDAYKPFEFATK